jgi:hypothetical protein
MHTPYSNKLFTSVETRTKRLADIYINGEIASIQYKKTLDLIAKLPKNADFADWWTVADSNR